MLYGLYGVLVHSGKSLHNGHYYCFVRGPNNFWYLMDDSSVRQVSEDTVLDQKAYMLFYLRMSDPGRAAGRSNEVRDRVLTMGWWGKKSMMYGRYTHVAGKAGGSGQRSCRR